jgi:hypothetical protein
MDAPHSMDSENGNVGAEPSPAPRSPPFFAVSIPKLIVMCVLTLNAYAFYWHYKNWQQLAKQPGYHGIQPFWRAVFSPFFCPALFERVAKVAEGHQVSARFEPGVMALLYIVLTAQLGGYQFVPGWVTLFAWLFVFSPLVVVQRTVNQLHHKIAPHAEPNSRFTVRNVAAIASVGALGASPFVLFYATGLREAYAQARHDAQLVADEYFAMRIAGDHENIDTLYVAQLGVTECDYCVAGPFEYLDTVRTTLGNLEAYELEGMDLSIAKNYLSGGTDLSYVWIVYRVSYEDVAVGEVGEALVLTREGVSGEFKIEAAEIGWATESENRFYVGWGRSLCADQKFDPQEDCPCALGPATGLPMCSS